MTRWLVILVFAAQPLFAGPASVLAACGGPDAHDRAALMETAGCCGEACPCAMETPRPEAPRPPMDLATITPPPLLVLIRTAGFVLPEPEPRLFTSASRVNAGTVPGDRVRPVLCVWLI